MSADWTPPAEAVEAAVKAMAMPRRNPHLPSRPVNGEHLYQRGPADIGGNRRCLLCGAYRGSDEGDRACLGEYKESGKMRAWAEDRWLKDRATAALAAVYTAIVAEKDAEIERLVAGVRAWCAINEVAEPPLDWAGLGEFLSRSEQR